MKKSILDMKLRSCQRTKWKIQRGSVQVRKRRSENRSGWKFDIWEPLAFRWYLMLVQRRSVGCLGGKAHFHSQGATALRGLVEEEELSQVTSRLEICWVILEQRKQYFKKGSVISCVEYCCEVRPDGVLLWIKNSSYSGGGFRSVSLFTVFKLYLIMKTQLTLDHFC